MEVMIAFESASVRKDKVAARRRQRASGPQRSPELLNEYSFEALSWQSPSKKGALHILVLYRCWKCLASLWLASYNGGRDWFVQRKLLLGCLCLQGLFSHLNLILYVGIMQTQIMTDHLPFLILSIFFFFFNLSAAIARPN